MAEKKRFKALKNPYDIRILALILYGVIALVSLFIFYQKLNKRLPDIQITMDKEPSIGSWALPIVGSIIAIGFIAMSILELIKPFIRLKFYKKHFENWFNLQDSNKIIETFKKLKLISLKKIKEIEKEDQRQKFIELTMAGDEDLLFKLPVDNLCGQLNNAAEIIIANPEEYPLLLVSLLGNKIDHSKQIEDNKDIFKTEESSNFVNARNRIAFLIQRNIDRFQIDLSLKWKYLLKSYSVFYCVIIAIIGSAYFDIADYELSAKFSFAIIAGILGSYISSIFRDIVAILEKLRK